MCYKSTSEKESLLQCSWVNINFICNYCYAAINCITCRWWLIHVAVSILGWQNASKALFFLFLNFLCSNRLFVFQALLIQDITSSDHNAQLVALGTAFRSGRGRTQRAHEQNNSIRERCFPLKKYFQGKIKTLSFTIPAVPSELFFYVRSCSVPSNP